MAKRDGQREKRLAEALRENLRRRKAQAREILPGTDGRASTRSGGVEGLPPATGEEAGPLHRGPPGPSPRSGDD